MRISDIRPPMACSQVIFCSYHFPVASTYPQERMKKTTVPPKISRSSIEFPLP